jgi:hypothetical protein
MRTTAAPDAQQVTADRTVRMVLIIAVPLGVTPGTHGTSGSIHVHWNFVTKLEREHVLLGTFENPLRHVPSVV